MNRLLICLALALGYFLWRAQPTTDASPRPTGHLASIASRMTPDDRKGFSEAYAILARAVAANPTADPVFPDTPSVRRAHRAAIEVVNRGVLNNNINKYPGLGDALEEAVTQGVGKEDVPLNPFLQQQVVKAFTDISASLK